MEDRATTARKADPAGELRRTLRAAKLSENLINVALACWRACQCATDRVGRVNVGDLADELGKETTRSIRRWLDQLAARGIIQVRSHNIHTGVYRLVMSHAGEGSIDLAPPPDTDDRQQSIDFAAAGEDEPPDEPAVLAFPKSPLFADRSSADQPSADRSSAHLNKPPASLNSQSSARRHPTESEVEEALSITAACRAAMIESSADGTRSATHAGTREDLRPKRPNTNQDLDLRPKDSSTSSPIEGPAARRLIRTAAATDGADPLAMRATFAAAGDASTGDLERRRAVAAAMARELAAGNALEPGFWMNLADTMGLGRFTEAEVRRALAYAIKNGGDEPARRAKIFSKSIKRRASECGAEWPRAP
ncbi:MAG: hypothetical protein AB7U73_01145 [Pirellulales bacterium]